MKTVIVIPTYNERKNIEQLVPELFTKVQGTNILVVDDDRFNFVNSPQDRLRPTQ